MERKQCNGLKGARNQMISSSDRTMRENVMSNERAGEELEA